MSPEDQRVWEEDAETEYAEAHAQARPATHSPADAEKVSQDAGEVERARVARYAEAMNLRRQSFDPYDGNGWTNRILRVMAVADSELASVVAENERLRGQVQRVRALADAFADDGLSRYGGNIAWHIEEAIANEKGDFPDAADTRIASQRERAESAEAEVERLRVRLAKVEALHVRIGLPEHHRTEQALAVAPDRCSTCWIDGNYAIWPCPTIAALADAPTEQTKGGE